NWSKKRRKGWSSGRSGKSNWKLRRWAESTAASPLTRIETTAGLTASTRSAKPSSAVADGVEIWVKAGRSVTAVAANRTAAPSATAAAGRLSGIGVDTGDASSLSNAAAPCGSVACATQRAGRSSNFSQRGEDG